MRNKRKLITRCTAFLGVFSVCMSISFFTGCSRESSTDHVFSHRGASGEETEHTFSAYDLAMLYGSKYIEQDLVTSKDGTLYVSHDLSAKRITGVDNLYSQMTDEEIDQLKTEEGEPILTLQSIFDKYGKTIHYVIELKENSVQTQKFKEIVAKNKMEKNIIVQASNLEPLKKLEKQYPEMPKLLLVKDQKELRRSVQYPEVDIISVNKKLMTEENVALVHDCGKKFNVWTVNSIQEITKAIDLGVDSYFTDYTAKALALEKKYR